MTDPTADGDWSPANLTPLAGGWSARTFLAAVGDERSVVRFLPPGPEGVQAAEVQAGLHRLVRGLVPVPEVLEVRPGRGEAPTLLITEWLPGERGDLVLPRLDAEAMARFGAGAGDLAARLAQMPTLRAGMFTAPDLRVRPFAAAEDLPTWVAEHEEAFGGWTATERSGLDAVAARAQDLLDGTGRTTVVHSDLNPKNLLVDPDTLTITGLVDWEYAHSGHPCTDLGNLLRFDRHPAYVDAVRAAWTARCGGSPEAALELARAADLWALVELAARAGQNPVADHAAGVLRAIAAARDLHAVP